MNISFNGYEDKVLTFATSSATVGAPVSLSANKTVSNAASGADIIGVAVSAKNGIAGVKMEGYIELPYTSTAPTVGFCGLVADGSNGVKVSTTSAKKYKVLSVDTTNSTVGFIL